MTICEGFTRSNEPTENYHLNLQLALALQSFMKSFNSLFSCSARNLTVLVHSH